VTPTDHTRRSGSIGPARSGASALLSGRYRLVIAALLFALGMINYMDRAALGILAPAVKSELHISSSQLGVVFSAFFASYAVFAFLGGYLSDRFGPKKTFLTAAIAWSVFCALTGAVHALLALVIVRLFFGAAEGPMNSTTNRMVTNWFPRKETARALGFSLSGQNFGSAFAAPIVIFAGYVAGWRMAFVALGVVGVLWSIVWGLLASDRPVENRHVTQGEQAHIVSDRAALPPSGEKPALRPYIFRVTTFGLALGLFTLLYPLYIFVSWMPSYFTGVLHLTPAQLSIAASVPWIGGFLGYSLGGVVADYVFRIGTNGLVSRKITTIVPLLISSAVLGFVSFVHTATLAVALFTLALFMLSMATQSLWAMIHEVTPASLMGGVGGFIHFLANMAGVVSPALTGYVLDAGGGYDSAFLIATGVGVVGALLIWLMVRGDGGHTRRVNVAPSPDLSSSF